MRIKSTLATYQSYLPSAERIVAIGAVCSVGFSTALTSIFCGLLLIFWFISGTVFQTLRHAIALPIGKTLLAFFLLLLLGFLNTDLEVGDAVDSLWSWRKIFYILILLFIFSDDKWKKIFAFSFLASSFFGLLFSFFSWFGLTDYQIGGAPGVVLQNWTTQGMIFGTSILVCFQLGLGAADFERRILVAIAILFALNVLFVTPSRSGYLALVIVSIVLFISRFGWRKFPWILVLIVTIASFAYFNIDTMKTKIDLGLKESEMFVKADEELPLNSITFRLTAYQNTFELISKKPFLGHGTGKFFDAYKEQVEDNYDDWRQDAITDPHNQYLFILTENGILGLSVFLLFILSVFLMHNRCDKYSLIGIAVMSVWVVTSLFSSHFRTFPEGHILGLFVGAMMSKSQEDIK